MGQRYRLVPEIKNFSILDLRNFEEAGLIIRATDDDPIIFDMTWTHQQVEEKLSSLFPTAFSWLHQEALPVSSSDRFFGPTWRILCKVQRGLHVDNCDAPTGRDIHTLCHRDHKTSSEKSWLFLGIVFVFLLICFANIFILIAFSGGIPDAVIDTWKRKNLSNYPLRFLSDALPTGSEEIDSDSSSISDSESIPDKMRTTNQRLKVLGKQRDFGEYDEDSDVSFRALDGNKKRKIQLRSTYVF